MNLSVVSVYSLRNQSHVIDKAKAIAKAEAEAKAKAEVQVMA